jgi:anti-sigma factor RsiW
MAGCSTLVSVLMEYLEGRLPSARREEFEAHLADCSRCLAYLNTYRSTVSLLGSLDDDDLPPELRVRLRAFLDGRLRN